MSETKIIDTIKVNDTTASILGAKYDETNGGIAFQGGTASGEKAFSTGGCSAGGNYSHAEGYNTRTTATTEFGYLMTDYQIADSTNQKIAITLTNTSGIQMTHTLAFDTDNDNLNAVQADILEIDSTQNKITLKAQLDPDWDAMKDISLNDLRKRFIYILHHPELGTVPRNGASYAHAEGNSTQARGNASHAEGCGGVAQGIYSHVEGYSSQEKDEEGNYKYGALDEASHAEGKNTKASGKYSHAEGDTTLAAGETAHAEGEGTEASGWASHAEGFETHAFGGTSHAEGQDTIASGHRSHAEGDASEAIGETSHTEGKCTKAFGKYSHAEGDNTISGGNSSHTEGYQTKTATEFGYEFFEVKNIIRPDGENHRGDYYLDLQLDSIEGLEIDFEITFDTDDQAIDMCSSIISKINHVDKIITLRAIDQDGYILAEADFSALKRKYFYIYDEPELGTAARNGAPYAHAEGNSTQALGEASHAEGKDTKATGNYSHAGGLGTIASEEAQTVIGKYNQEDSNALFTVGNGTASTPSNAFVVKTDGTVWAGNKELTADTVVDNTIQDFKVSSSFINGDTITRDETTTFIYNYENAAGNTLFQYLNPPLSNIYDISDITPGKTATTTLSSQYQYLTTERWCGKPVYTSIIKISPYNNNSDSRIKFKFNCANCIIIRENSLSIKKTGEFSYSHPLITAGGNTGLTFYFKIDNASKGSNDTALCSIRAQNSGFYLNDAVKDYYIIAQIWYVKEIPEAIISSSTTT